MSASLFQGTHTAMVTPMLDGAVDFAALETFIEHQIENRIDGLVAVGTTGESPTLANNEHIGVIEATVRIAGGRVPVLAGTGSNSTDEAVELTRRAEAAGADGFLVVAPYYNKPTQEGLFRHFSAIASATRRPVLLYSIPSRCGVAIEVETSARLFEAFPHVCGMKEAGGRSEQVTRLVNRLGPEFAVVSGDDSLTLPFMAAGAVGVVSVASNAYPAAISEMVRLALGNDFAAARRIHQRYAPVFENLFIETNPVPVKHLLHHLGRIPSPEVRLPLCPLSENSALRLLGSLPNES